MLVHKVPSDLEAHEAPREAPGPLDLRVRLGHRAHKANAVQMDPREL